MTTTNTHIRTLGHEDVASDAEISIRSIGESDRAELRRLAELEGREVPASPLLGAFAGEQLLAALSLRDGSVVADPFVASGHAADLLRFRNRQLDRGRLVRGRRRVRGALRAARAVPS